MKDIPIPIQHFSTDRPMSVDDKLDAIMQKLIEMDISITELRSTLVATFKDEFSPERHEVSRKLGSKVAERLRGEFLAREQTAPTGAWWCKACMTAHPLGFYCLYSKTSTGGPL